jgi:hypothetical protein
LAVLDELADGLSSCCGDGDDGANDGDGAAFSAGLLFGVPLALWLIIMVGRIAAVGISFPLLPSSLRATWIVNLIITRA